MRSGGSDQGLGGSGSACGGAGQGPQLRGMAAGKCRQRIVRNRALRMGGGMAESAARWPVACG